MTAADLLLVGTRVRTLDPRRPEAHAVAVAGDRIVALDDDALAVRGPATEVVDLAGAVTTPGLVDGHAHPLLGATAFRGADLSGCRGALALVDPDRAAAFAESWLAPLLAIDSDGVLVETLRSFLAHHGSQLQVSADLGVHRNTVRSRVRQIEQALGRSLAEPQTRVDAWVALTARES